MRWLLVAGLLASIGLAPGARADEIHSLDEWWTAYDGYWGAGDVKKAAQIVAEYKKYACEAFNEGLRSYQQYRGKNDIASMRQFYVFLDRLSQQIQEKHGSDSYVKDLEAETANDDEELGAAKRRKDAVIIDDQAEFRDTIIELVRAPDLEKAGLIVRDNPERGTLLFNDLMFGFKRAQIDNNQPELVGIHQILEPLQEILADIYPLEQNFTRYEPPARILAVIAASRRRKATEEEKANLPDPVDIARDLVAEGVALREKGYWEEAVVAIEEGQATLELLGVSQEELIIVHQELARTHLEYGDYSAAARSYREMARAASFVGDDDALKNARNVLDRMPPDNRPALDDPDNWRRWKTVKLKNVSEPKKKEDPYGPMRQVDPRVELWRSADLSTAEEVALGPPGVKLIRTSGGAIKLDVDGDGRGDYQPDLETGKPILFSARYPDKSKVDYAISLRQFNVFDYMDFTFDHSRRSIIFYRRVGYREGRIGSTPVRITDDDCDGRFDGYGSDGIVIGRNALGTTLSRIITTGSDIYEIDVEPNGQSLRWRPYKGPTHTVGASSAIGVVRNFIIASAEDSDVYLELTPVGKGVKIPAGKWKFHEALLADKLLQERVWVNGDQCAPQEATGKGPPLMFSIGRGLGYQFDAAAEDEQVRFHGLSFHMVGEQKEVYEGYYPTAPMPMLSVLMKFPDSDHEVVRSGQALRRDSSSPSHRDVEFPKDMVFEFKAENTVFTKLNLEHSILGDIATEWRQQEVTFPKPEEQPERESGKPEDGPEKEGGDGDEPEKK